MEGIGSAPCGLARCCTFLLYTNPRGMTSSEIEARVIAFDEGRDQHVDLCIATGADTDAVVALYDEAVAWLVARGRSDQWGATPFSSRPAIVAMIRARAESGTMWVARSPKQLLGATVIGSQAPHYIDHPAEGPEIYISGMIASRAPNARGIGRVLLEHAAETARRASIDLLRLDCYAGSDGRLVAYYESVGFSQVDRFAIELMGSTYSGCLLEQRLTTIGQLPVHN